MKTRLILTIVLLVAVSDLQAQGLLRPDSSRTHWFMKPSSIHEALKTFTFDAFRNIDEFQKKTLSVFDTFPATWSQFKCTFLDLPLPEEFDLLYRFSHNMEMRKNYNDSIWYDPENNFRTICKVGNESRRGEGGLSTSIIQMLYDEYSHEGKMWRKYDNLIQQDDFERQIYPKYSIALVKQITGFTSDSATYIFMLFCDFKNDSLMQANNYDIYWMIQNCLSQFLNR